MPTLAQRQRAAAAAAASTSSKAALSSSSASTSTQQQRQHQQQSLKQTASSSSSTTTDPKQQSRQDKRVAEATSEESNYSDEDSEEDETAVAFEMDSQELWTQNYCATCDCLIEPGQGVGIKKEKEEEAMIRPSTSNISRNSGLKSKTGTIKARPGSSDGNGYIKRTHSAGKLHATGTAGPLGPHKRTGSAAGRLNALSELRPTTKLNGEINRPKGNGGDAKRSPGLSRRDSAVSDQSAGANSTSSSGPSSPISPNQSLATRTKKSMVVPTDEDIHQSKVHSTPALYCSERCQQIDEQRSSGLGELVYYLHQPVSPTASNWSVNGLNNSLGYNSWSSRNLAMANRTSSNVPGSPESECNCPECMDKNSASGTVPSGASDTTESSGGYAYGQGRRKQRTQSGRIVTPQSLLPPGDHNNDYFGYVGSNGQRKSIPKASQRGPLDTISQTSSTEASRLSSESAVSEMWEPKVKQNRQSTIRSPKTTQESHTSSVSDETYGAATTGTVTPAATISSPRRSESPFVWHAGSQIASASPLRLLRQGDHHSHPSVDVTSEFAQSPQPNASGFLSHSLAASEHTELAASSGFTVGGVTAMQHQGSSMSSSILERRRETSETSRITPFRMTNSPLPSEATTAIGTLKNAQSRNVSEALTQANLDDRRQSTSGSSIASSTTSTWLRNSISSAWNTLRGLPASASTPDTNFNANRDGNESQFNDDTLHQMDSMTLMGEDVDPTPKQSQISRPKTTRGDIPAFANEIGRGEIPGEGNNNHRSSYHSQDDRLSKSLASAHETVDEERRRRKSEKERAQRHQRSKDVTVLPPLLGVSRTSSGINLPAHSITSRPHYSQQSSSASLTGIHNRNRAGSYGQQNLMSSSSSQLNGLTQTTTPALRPGQIGSSGRMTPTIELGSSPGRMMSVGSLGTSPRRGGLGWGAMTTIASPDATQTTLASSRPSSHASHRHRHRHHQSSGSSTRQSHRSSGSSNSGSSNNNLVILGNIGHLGFHPHGSGPIYGRHATTPVRSSTPRVPEDGGEMSGAALKGEEQQNDIYSQSQRRSSMAPPLRPRSGMMLHRQNDLHLSSSNLKRNSTGLSPLIHQRNLSSEEREEMAPAVKMYPVLNLPNRQPTHDRYDSNWLSTGPEDAAAAEGHKQIEQQAFNSTRHTSQATDNANTNQDSTTLRKRLFYFDTT